MDKAHSDTVATVILYFVVCAQRFPLGKPYYVVGNCGGCDDPLQGMRYSHQPLIRDHPGAKL